MDLHYIRVFRSVSNPMSGLLMGKKNIKIIELFLNEPAKNNPVATFATRPNFQMEFPLVPVCPDPA